MYQLITLILTTIMILTTTVFDFNKNSELNQWYLINDTVMGGRSNSSFKINKEGHVSFSGYVTTANNGGFASVRYDCDIDDVKTASHVLLRVKGDGKKYQLRFKKERSDYYSHIYNFKTSGEWETISIPMEEMYASYRGRTLDVPNFKADQIREISILIGNKKNEEFELLIDKIEMR